MVVFDILAGSGSFAKEAKKQGHIAYSLDWIAYEGIDIVADAEFIKPEDFPCIPDHVHVSFDCTTYTIAAISKHRNGTEPKSEYAMKCDRVNKNIISLIKHWQGKNEKLTYDFENPRGMLRHMPWMQEFKRYTVWYCQYGDDRAKPTDIWTNLDWTPRPECRNYKYGKDGNVINKHCHHETARRGAKTGTQGRKGSYERSRIPAELCKELLSRITANEFVLADH